VLALDSVIAGIQAHVDGLNQISHLIWNLKRYDGLAQELDELYDRIFIAGLSVGYVSPVVNLEVQTIFRTRSSSSV